MKVIEHAKEGLLNLYFAKMRSVLALIGVLVGTASVVAMVLGGELATNEALKEFKSLGTDLLAVTINNSSNEQSKNTGKSETLDLSQALNLKNAHQNILNLAPYTQLFHPVFYNGNPVNGVILGVTDSFAEIVHIKINHGRFISIADKYNFYCVIGHDVYEQIKKISHEEPIGQTLQIGKNIFVIIGVAESWPENSFVYANIDTAVMVPLLSSTVLSKYAEINNLIFQLSPETNISEVEQKVKQSLNFISQDKEISFRSAKELINKMRKQSDILTIFLGLIGSISLMVGGIGVMNIMLVSVMERRKEIGIRLAVGAKRSDIGILFLMEAIMLSLVGGLIGVTIGILIAYVISIFWHWEFIFYVWPPLVGFSVSVAVGIFFGFYPAFVASKLNPIDALKAE